MRALLVVPLLLVGCASATPMCADIDISTASSPVEYGGVKTPTAHFECAK